MATKQAKKSVEALARRAMMDSSVSSASRSPTDRAPTVSETFTSEPSPSDSALAAVQGVVDLTPSQRIAIEKLTAGDTVSDAARAAGVSRMTLHRWLKSDPHFTAAYNVWQHESIATARGRLLALTGDAVSAVATAVRAGDSRAAITILKSMGLLDRPNPGATDPAIVEQDQQTLLAKDHHRRFMERLNV